MKGTILYLLLYLFFLITPSESISIIEGGNFSLPKLTVIALAFAFLASAYIRTMRMSRFMILILLYASWALISSVFSINLENAFSRWLTFMLPMIFLLLIVNTLVIDKRIVRNVMYSYILGCIIPIVSMVKMLMSGTAIEERMTALGQDQNELATILSIGLTFTFYLLSQYRNKPSVRFLLILFCFLCSFSILLTGSRTGFVELILILFIGIISLGKRTVVFATFVGVVLIPFLISYVPDTSIQRLLQTQDQIASGDFTGRGYIWHKGYEAFSLQPPYRFIIGVGYEQFPSLFKEAYGYEISAHNTYLAVFLEQGIIGILLFILILFTVIRHGIIYSIRQKTLVNIIILIPILMSMITLGLQTRRWLWIILLIVYLLSKEGQLRQDIK